MDYLIQNNVYTFQTGSMALNKKSELDTFEFQDKEEEKKIKKKCSTWNILSYNVKGKYNC